MREEEVRAEYGALLPRLWAFQASLVARLRRFEIGGGEIRSRIKTWESIRDKLARSNAHHVTDVQDLVGIRLVVPDIQAFLRATEAIEREFQLRAAEARHVRFDEPAAHFVVRDGASPFETVSAEIQILTAAEDARRTLEHELNYVVGSGDLRLGSPPQAATTRLSGILEQFAAILERPDVHEKRDIHAFLKEHSFILLPNPDAVISEVPIGLGTEFRIDFLVQQPNGAYLLIEIENPRMELFIKSGDFSSGVNHALRQVEDWQEWIEANLPTVERYYPGIRSPEAWVIVGRDRELAESERRRLARRNINLRGRVALRTYDDLLRDAGAYVRSLRRALGG